MRLSIFSTMSEAPWGGSEELWADTARAALKSGWQVQALLPGFKEQHPKRAALLSAGVQMSSWTYDDLRKWQSATKTPESPALNPYRSLLHPKPDLLVISHGGLMDMVNAHGGILSDLWSSGVPYVIIIQANTEGYFPNDTQRAFMRNYFDAALQVVFVSRENLEMARRQMASPLRNAVVWQQPVNLAVLKPVKWYKDATLSMASVARVDALAKGHDLLLEVLSTPTWRSRAWNLNLYGTGPSVSLIQDMATHSGIGDRIHFHGQVSDVAQIWRNNHVLVMPSRLEGTPLALLEALCCGRPAVVTNVGGSADWIVPGKTGFIADYPRTGPLAQAMEQLWDARNQLSELGDNAARFMEQSFHPRPGETLLAYLEAQLSLHRRAGAIEPLRPTLSIVRIVNQPLSEGGLPTVEGSGDVEFITVAVGNSAVASSAKQPHRILSETRNNLAVAANHGVAAARGEYILLLENDEGVTEEFLKRAVTTLKAKSDLSYIGEDAGSSSGQIPKLGIFAVEAWRAAGGFPPNVQNGYRSWLWNRVRSRGEKIEVFGKAKPVIQPASKAPRITVVVTCYNYAQYLERCVDSVLAQDFRDFEVVIVNDGSTDISPLIADWIGNLHPNRVRVLHQPNSGQPAISRNRGIELARGELILPLDADDWIAPSFLREMVEVLEREPGVSVAFADTLYCHESGNVQIHPTGIFDIANLRENNQLSCCSLYRKKVWSSVGGYRTNVRGYEDWDFWIAAAAAGFKGKRVPRPLFFYRAKDSGVFSETVTKDKARRAQIRLNNPSVFTAQELAAAKAYLESESAASSGTDPLETHRQEVSAKYQNSDWPGCIAACKKILAVMPDDTDVLLVYADALAKAGQGKAALAAVDHLIALQPELSELKEMRAGILASGADNASARPLVSVVIPCYKQAEFLPESIESVVAQSYPHWEILVVNDGSPDETSEVTKSLMQKYRGRTIRLIEKENGGLSDARNAGIRFAKGAYILPLDADDKIDPTFLEKTVSLLEADPQIAIAYTDWVYFGAQTARRNAVEYDFERLCTKENLFTCTSLYRREAWEAVGGYNINMTRGVEDWDFWISCGEKGFVGKRIPEPLFFYRQKAGSMIHTLQPHLQAMFARIVLNHPNVYNPDMLKAAQKIFTAAKLPPAKPSSLGVEWKAPTSEAVSGFHVLMNEAETAIRESRLTDALRVLDQALLIAPDEQSATRTKEIIGLLKEESAQPTTPEAPTSPDDFFGPDEVTSVEQQVAAYANNPGDEGTASQLVSLQQGLLNFLVTADPAELEKHFRGSFGKVFRLLVKSGLNSAVPTEASSEQLKILDDTIEEQVRSGGTIDFRPLLGRMLVAPSHRLSNTDVGAAAATTSVVAAVSIEHLPAWLEDDFAEYVFQAPQVFLFAGEVGQYHGYMLALANQVVRRMEAAPKDAATLKVATWYGTKANFIPIYFHHGNTLEISEKRAAIMEFMLKQHGAVLDTTLPKRPKDRKKIKVGILSAHFGPQTETHVTLPAMHLDRSRFEICLFCVASHPGPIENYCRSLADSITVLPKNLHEQVAAIRAAALDVVIIGTNVTAVTNQISLIAQHRLAPVQLSNYCSPVSTGMRNVDGYLTGTFMKAESVHEEFSEVLHFVEGPPGCLDYTVEAKEASQTFTRASLGLGADEIVFVNAASCFKILPELQETWAKILSQVPKSRLLLLPFNPNWATAFPVRQFEQTLTAAGERHGISRDRFILAGSLRSRADVKALERIADIYLDTAPFSGSIAVIDPLELGLPTIVWEGGLHRSRMASALLRELQIPELITNSEAGYIQTAVKIATNAQLRADLSARILAGMKRAPRFLDANAYGKQLSTLLARITSNGSAATGANALSGAV